jgi:rhamnulose-1-phosphate aldolase
MSPTSLLPTALTSVVDVCADIYRLGWAENHAGNLTYRLTPEQLAEFDLHEDGAPVDLPFPSPSLGGQSYLVTAAGSPFRTTVRDPRTHIGVVEIDPAGAHYVLRWGFETGRRPTSEFPAHLRAHERRQLVGSDDRVVLHCHPTHIIAMSHVHPLQEERFTRTLWSMNSESILAITEGIGLLPWMVCGTDEIGIESAVKLAWTNFVIWAYHGVLVTAGSPDAALGAIESVNKAAATWLLAGGVEGRGITIPELRELAAAFGFVPDTRMLEITAVGA